MYHHILLALAPDHEGTLPALMQAAEALVAPQGRVSLLTVIEPIPDHVAKHLPPDQQSRHLRLVREALPKTLPSGRAITGLTQEGHAARSLLEIAQGQEVDCIVLASHRPGLRDYFLGSTASQVVRHATCSVHVIRNSALLTP